MSPISQPESLQNATGIASSEIAVQQTEPIFPPGDLWSDEPPLESDLHRDQIDLLIRLLKWYWRGCSAVAPCAKRTDFYATGNLTVYYSPNQKKSEDFRGPDFFVVLGVEPRDRRSWVVWQEGGRYPNYIIELLSDSTASVDRGLKKDLYQNVWRVPEYFWFHPDTLEFAGFRLADGSTYAPIPTTVQGWRWSQQLQLYLGIHDRKLRFFTADGQLIPFPEEDALEQARQAQAALEQEKLRADRLAQRLRELGIAEGD
ncbi:Uma2 family endonuclease [Myxacorys almedinensis]|uniref:Uma2 family endonuclease n=1 Tax=Myxacorys almedinensis A TaxID=2690445 RepID=A0A8J7Z0V9_9CYAN|nr:Uma2 family endonuclease [Myxacorys almedinensis]NDJ18059.1 Uma2 family endonuclease [Myxacorys almedinensis A]